MFPNYVDATPTRLAASVRALATRLETSRAVMVPGHGALVTPKGMADYEGLLESLEAAARAGHAAGTPVAQVAVPTKLDMTAPVTQTAAPGGFLVQFVLPKGVSAASAPEPLDSRVRLRDVAPNRVAVIRYSGFWSDSNYDEHLAKLQTGLRTAGIVWKGEPVYSRYNAPFTPWFMRRNEIWLQLVPDT